MAKRSGSERVYAVIGLGLFGERLSQTLSGKGGAVIAIDKNPDLIERVKEHVSQAILLDAADEAALDQAPLDDVDVAIVGMADDLQASILITAILKSRGLPHVIARATSELHAQILRRVGADEVINVETDAGVRLANRLVAPRVLEQVALSAEISVAEMRVPPSLVGQTLAGLDLRNRHRISVISIRRDRVSVDESGDSETTEEIIFPGPDDRLKDDDVLHVIGKNESIRRFQDLS